MKKIKIISTVLIVASCSFSFAENNKKTVDLYKNQIKKIEQLQIEKINNKGINFSDISFSLCQTFMQGFVSSKVKNKNDMSLFKHATDMLSVAYCQDLEYPSDMQNSFMQMINSQQNRSIEEISNAPPLINITAGAIEKHFKNNP